MTNSTLIPPKPTATLTSKPELLQLMGNPAIIVWKLGKGVEDRCFSGVVVHCGESKLRLHSLGYSTDRWVTDQFRRFEGSIMLEND